MDREKKEPAGTPVTLAYTSHPMAVPGVAYAARQREKKLRELRELPDPLDAHSPERRFVEPKTYPD